MALSICESFQTAAKRLLELGLGYLTLDRAAIPRFRPENGRECSGTCGAEPHDRRAVRAR